MSNDEPQHPPHAPATSEPPLASTPAPKPAPAANDRTARTSIAWQPITPRGVAAFAPATTRRLLLIQLLVALLSSAVVVWFVSACWFPAIRTAIQHLPDQGRIRNQEFRSPHHSTEPLVDGRYLAFVLNPRDEPSGTAIADLRVELRRTAWRVCSFFGCSSWPYAKGWEFSLSRPELEPWWGAWQPIFKGILSIGVVFGLIFTWSLLAALYSPFALLLAYFKDREATWAGAYRLAGAALIPGSLIMLAGIVAYGSAILDLILFCLATILHVLVPWVYVVLGVLALPRNPQAPTASTNPFTPPEPALASSQNPFAAPPVPAPNPPTSPGSKPLP